MESSAPNTNTTAINTKKTATKKTKKKWGGRRGVWQEKTKAIETNKRETTKNAWAPSYFIYMTKIRFYDKNWEIEIKIISKQRNGVDLMSFNSTMCVYGRVFRQRWGSSSRSSSAPSNWFQVWYKCAIQYIVLSPCFKICVRINDFDVVSPLHATIHTAKLCFETKGATTTTAENTEWNTIECRQKQKISIVLPFVGCLICVTMHLNEQINKKKTKQAHKKRRTTKATIMKICSNNNNNIRKKKHSGLFVKWSAASLCLYGCVVFDIVCVWLLYLTSLIINHHDGFHGGFGGLDVWMDRIV